MSATEPASGDANQADPVDSDTFDDARPVLPNVPATTAATNPTASIPEPSSIQFGRRNLIRDAIHFIRSMTIT
jgi:hypothetical protein